METNYLLILIEKSDFFCCCSKETFEYSLKIPKLYDGINIKLFNNTNILC